MLSREGASNRRNGLVILDVSDPNVGVRKVAEYDDQLTGGVHNTFIHDGYVYALSGALLGNLYRQGREIARFLPLDPEGFVPNAPQVFGAQPHKGTIFFSDMNSGLWAVRLGELPSEGPTNGP